MCKYPPLVEHLLLICKVQQVLILIFIRAITLSFFFLIIVYCMSGTIIRVEEKGSDSRVSGRKGNETKKAE